MKLNNTFLNLLLIGAALIFIIACGKKEQPQTSATEGTVDSTEELSTSDNDNAKIEYVSDIEDLLSIEAEELYEPFYEDREMTERDKKALALANRVETMYESIDSYVADNVWMWAEATDIVVRQYAKHSGVQYSSAVTDLHEALTYLGYDCGTQLEMNRESYYLNTIHTYDAVMAYKQMIDKISDSNLKHLIRAEFNAWSEWFDAEFFTYVHYYHGEDSYSSLPLVFGEYHYYLINNRLAALKIEQDILTNRKVYNQRGKTVSSSQWNKWLSEQGYSEGMSPDFNMDEPTETDFPALIKDKTERWLAARQAIATYLGDKEEPGKSYDNLTADIHSCIIGQLKPMVKYDNIYE